MRVGSGLSTLLPPLLKSHGPCSATPRLPWALRSWQGWVGVAEAETAGLWAETAVPSA